MGSAASQASRITKRGWPAGARAYVIRVEVTRRSKLVPLLFALVAFGAIFSLLGQDRSSGELTDETLASLSAAWLAVGERIASGEVTSPVRIASTLGEQTGERVELAGWARLVSRGPLAPGYVIEKSPRAGERAVIYVRGADGTPWRLRIPESGSASIERLEFARDASRWLTVGEAAEQVSPRKSGPAAVASATQRSPTP